MKLRTSGQDFSRFIEPQGSSRYAAYAKEDVLANLNQGAELDSIRKGPEVMVVAEASD